MKMRKALLVVIMMVLISSLAFGADMTSEVDYLEDCAYGYGRVSVTNRSVQVAKGIAINKAKANLLEEVFFSRLRSPVVKIKSFEDNGEDWRIKGLIQVDQIKAWKIKRGDKTVAIKVRVRVPIYD